MAVQLSCFYCRGDPTRVALADCVTPVTSGLAKRNINQKHKYIFCNDPIEKLLRDWACNACVPARTHTVRGRVGGALRSWGKDEMYRCVCACTRFSVIQRAVQFGWDFPRAARERRKVFRGAESRCYCRSTPLYFHPVLSGPSTRARL